MMQTVPVTSYDNIADFSIRDPSYK